MFERKDQKLKDEVTYYVGLPGKVKEEDIPTDSEEQRTDLYNSKDSSDVFVAPAAEDNFVRLQRVFYQKYGEHKKHSQCVWVALQITFPIASTHVIVSQLPTGRRWRSSLAKYY